MQALCPSQRQSEIKYLGAVGTKDTGLGVMCTLYSVQYGPLVSIINPPSHLIFNLYRGQPTNPGSPYTNTYYVLIICVCEKMNTIGAFSQYFYLGRKSTYTLPYPY